jgi:hypothetical protein
LLKVLKLEPILEQARKDRQETKLIMSITLRADPQRLKLRKLILLPSAQKFKTENGEPPPKRIWLKTLMFEPNRDNARTEISDPTFRKSHTLIADPIMANERIETLLPRST